MPLAPVKAYEPKNIGMKQPPPYKGSIRYDQKTKIQPYQPKMYQGDIKDTHPSKYKKMYQQTIRPPTGRPPRRKRPKPAKRPVVRKNNPTTKTKLAKLYEPKPYKGSIDPKGKVHDGRMYNPRLYKGTIRVEPGHKPDYVQRKKPDKNARYVPEKRRRLVQHRTLRPPQAAGNYVPTAERLRPQHRTLKMAQGPVMASYVPTFEKRRKEHRTLRFTDAAPVVGERYQPTYARAAPKQHRKIAAPVVALGFVSALKKAAPVPQYKPTTERRRVERRTLVAPVQRRPSPPKESFYRNSPTVDDPLREIPRGGAASANRRGPVMVAPIAAAARGNTPSPIPTPPHHRPQQPRSYSPVYYPVRRSPTPEQVFRAPIFASDIREDSPKPSARQATPLKDPMKPRARSPFLYESPPPPEANPPVRQARYLSSYHTPRAPFFSPMIPVEPQREPSALRMNQTEAFARNEQSKHPLVPFAEYYGLRSPRRPKSPLDYSYNYGKTSPRNGQIPSFNAVGTILRSLHGYNNR